jgi:hypothetical protein
MIIPSFLYNQFFAPSINQADAATLIGKEAVITCTKVKTSGGIRGKMDESGYEVNISPKKVQRYQTVNSVSVVEGDCLKIKIMEFKSNGDKDYFTAEIVEKVKNE